MISIIKKNHKIIFTAIECEGLIILHAKWIYKELPDKLFTILF